MCRWVGKRAPGGLRIFKLVCVLACVHVYACLHIPSTHWAAPAHVAAHCALASEWASFPSSWPHVCVAAFTVAAVARRTPAPTEQPPHATP